MVQIQNASKIDSPWTHWFLYGKTGSGKTTAAATFPAPFFIVPRNEGSILTLQGKDVDYAIVENRAEMVDVLNYLQQKHDKMEKCLREGKEDEADAAFPYQTIVVESLSHYMELLVQDISAQNTRKMDQQGWGALSTHVGQLHSVLRSLQCHVVFTSLAAVDDNGEGAPLLVGKQKTMLPSACDVVAYCDVNERGKNRTPTYTVHYTRKGPFYARARIQGFPNSQDNFRFADIEKHLAGE